MEEKIAQQRRQQQQQRTPPQPTVTTTAAHLSDQQVVVGVTSGSGDSGRIVSMGRIRTGSSSNSVGWMAAGDGGGGGGGGGGVGGGNGNGDSGVKTPTTPRQPSQRDSGYHTDCSPATATLCHPVHFTFDGPAPPEPSDPFLSATSSSSSSSAFRGPCSPPSLSDPAPPRSSCLKLPNLGWQPRRTLTNMDSDDEGDDDAFASDNVPVGVVSDLSESPRVTLAAAQPDSAAGNYLGSLAARRTGQPLACDDAAPGVGADPCPDSSRTVAAHRLRGEETVGGQFTAGNSSSLGNSPRNVRFHAVRHVVHDSDDNEEDEGSGVASTNYHHAPLSMVSLPGGERIRPLLARTTSTQTPNLHCQLIDQILACPQEFPQCARGSAVRRLRYYSEGEETVSVPLPDIVPVTHGHRERSLSAPDLEAIQRQRQAAREVGRELRRISDEFLRRHEENREHPNPDGALAALHAELNGVAAFFLTGVRRFLYRGFAAYFRHVFHWTRQAMAATMQPPDSSVDDQR